MSFTAGDTDFDLDAPSLIETVEDYLHTQNWHFMRPSNEELFVEVAGDQGKYKLFFLWDETTSSLQICCETDVILADTHNQAFNNLLANVNTRMWLGHFDATRTQNKIIPCFRYTGLYRGLSQEAGSHMINGLVQLAITECDRTRQAFVMLDQDTSDTALFDLALAAPAGRG